MTEPLPCPGPALVKMATMRPASAAGNARLTGTAGIVLLILLAVQGVTVPSVRSMLTLHVFVGFLLIPPVLVKMGSTGYRAFRYYTRDPSYRAAGAPQPALRILAPLVVVLTVIVIASGVALVAGGRRRTGWLLTVHKASFVLWFLAMTVHVLAYVWRAAGLAWGEVTGGPRVRGRRARLTLVVGSVVTGVALAVATVGWARPWRHGRDAQAAAVGRPASVGRPSLSQARNSSQRSEKGHQSHSTPVWAGKSHAS